MSEQLQEQAVEPQNISVNIEEQKESQQEESYLCSSYNYLKQLQSSLPQNIASKSIINKDLILNKASLNTRHMTLCLLSMVVAAHSFKSSPNHHIIRNTFLSYVGFGIILTPEIMNPYLIFRINNSEK